MGYRLTKVGWIFAQSSEERDFIVSAEELRQMAAMQAEIGETGITAIVSLDMSEDEGHVHFEVVFPLWTLNGWNVSPVSSGLSVLEAVRVSVEQELVS